ncbi:MAG: (deoxy)nucleoside triphosphate pyrophosphohydrolase, partial [Gammaproteobacteria bacterium]|nr:(deoxy)nucleoside triphosphate pyrophosphohydrolase [Gammaproteobacteria bacterium]
MCASSPRSAATSRAPAVLARSTSNAMAGSSDHGAPRIDVVVALIRDSSGRVLVSRRRPGSHMAGFWEFPGGKRDSGEAARDALARELDEELGICVLSAEPFMSLDHEYPDR